VIERVRKKIASMQTRSCEVVKKLMHVPETG
jgi:hypothetical protein